MSGQGDGSVWFDPSVIAAYIAVGSGGIGWLVSRLVGRIMRKNQESAAALSAQLTGWVSLVQALESRVRTVEAEHQRCEDELRKQRLEIDELQRRH